MKRRSYDLSGCLTGKRSKTSDLTLLKPVNETTMPFPV